MSVLDFNKLSTGIHVNLDESSNESALLNGESDDQGDSMIRIDLDGSANVSALLHGESDDPGESMIHINLNESVNESALLHGESDDPGDSMIHINLNESVTESALLHGESDDQGDSMIHINLDESVNESALLHGESDFQGDSLIHINLDESVNESALLHGESDFQGDSMIHINLDESVNESALLHGESDFQGDSMIHINLDESVNESALLHGESDDQGDSMLHSSPCHESVEPREARSSIIEGTISPRVSVPIETSLLHRTEEECEIASDEPAMLNRDLDDRSNQLIVPSQCHRSLNPEDEAVKSSLDDNISLRQTSFIGKLAITWPIHGSEQNCGVPLVVLNEPTMLRNESDDQIHSVTCSIPCYDSVNADELQPSLLVRLILPHTSIVIESVLTNVQNTSEQARDMEPAMSHSDLDNVLDDSLIPPCPRHNSPNPAEETVKSSFFTKTLSQSMSAVFGTSLQHSLEQKCEMASACLKSDFEGQLDSIVPSGHFHRSPLLGDEKIESSLDDKLLSPQICIVSGSVEASQQQKSEETCGISTFLYEPDMSNRDPENQKVSIVSLSPSHQSGSPEEVELLLLDRIISPQFSEMTRLVSTNSQHATERTFEMAILTKPATSKNIPGDRDDPAMLLSPCHASPNPKKEQVESILIDETIAPPEFVVKGLVTSYPTEQECEMASFMNRPATLIFNPDNHTDSTMPSGPFREITMTEVEKVNSVLNSEIISQISIVNGSMMTSLHQHPPKQACQSVLFVTEPALLNSDPENQNNATTSPSSCHESRNLEEVISKCIDGIVLPEVLVENGVTMTTSQHPPEQICLVNPVVESDSTVNGVDGIKIQLRRRPWNCDTCEKSFSSSSYLTQHIWIHFGDVEPSRRQHGENVYGTTKFPRVQGRSQSVFKLQGCADCKLSFSRATSLHRHVSNRHRTHGHRMLRRSQSQKVGENDTFRTKHVVLPRSVVRSESANASMLRIIRSQPKKSWTCDVCNKVLKRSNSLKRHKLIHRSYKCGQCDKYCGSSVSLKDHEQSHGAVQSFKCADCSSSFAYSRNLRRHALIKHTNVNRRLLKCPRCPTVYENKSLLGEHMRFHTARSDARIIQSQPKKSWTCDVCNKVLKRSNSLKRHKLIHRSYKCGQCDKYCGSSVSLKDHEQSHGAVQSFKCVDCSSSFAYLGNLRRHALIKHKNVNRRMFSCLKSSKVYKNKNLLNKHTVAESDRDITNVSGTGRSKSKITRKCDVCDKVLKSSKSLKRHKLIHRPFKTTHRDEDGGSSASVENHEQRSDAVKSYTCSECRISLSSSGSLRRHNLVKHKNVNRGTMKSSTCPKVYKNETHLVKRVSFCAEAVPVDEGDKLEKTLPKKSSLKIRDHSASQNRPYMCQDCDQSYATSDQFRRHVRCDHDDDDRDDHDQPFECQQCRKVLALKSELIKHMSIHKAVKPLTCDECFKSFVTAKNLRQHSVIHGGTKPFKCDSCDKSFWWKGSSVAHSRSHMSTMFKLRAIHGAKLPYTCDDWL